MSLLRPADLSASLEQTARVLGVGRATGHRLQAQFRHQRQRGGPPRKTRGGCRRALMSPQEEDRFLKPWAGQAHRGGVLVVAPRRAAWARRLGRPVAAAAVDRFPARPGWPAPWPGGMLGGRGVRPMPAPVPVEEQPWRWRTC